MFDIGWTELILVAAVAILVVGPKDLPGMLRTFGRTFGNLKRMASDFQRQFNSALEEAELDQLQKDLKQAQSIDPLAHLKKDLMDPIEETTSDINKSIKSDPAPSTSEKKPDSTSYESTSSNDATPSAPVSSDPVSSDPGPAGDQKTAEDWSRRLDDAVASPPRTADAVDKPKTVNVADKPKTAEDASATKDTTP